QTAPGESNVLRSQTRQPDSNPYKCRISALTIGTGNRELHIERSFDVFGNLDAITAQAYDHGGQPLPQRIHQVGWGSANGAIGGSGLFPVWEKTQLYPATTRTFDGASGLLLTETDPNSILRMQ